jgi:chemotaxis-related protein WspB
MLFLKFKVGAEAYVLDALQIAEVLPLVNIRCIAQAAACVAGLINYRGRPVPVIDLSELMLGKPAQRHISTRLILVRHGEHLLGLIAEHATETLRRDAADFVESGIASDAAPYLGPVTLDADRLFQWIEIDKLLPASVSGVLFRQVEEQPWSSPELQHS